MRGKLVVLSVLALFMSSVVTAQSTSESGSEQTMGGGQSGTVDELPLKPFRLPSLSDVGGSPFLTEEFMEAKVEMGQGRIIKDVLLKFNVFNNNMLVLRDGQSLKLDFFEQVSFSLMDNRGIDKQYVFRAGYPAIDNQNENTIYQVLSMGPKVHFLKYISQKVEEVPTLGDYSRREIVTTENYYVYTPGGEISKLKSMKAGKQSLVEALPTLADRIQEIASAKNLRLKSETDISLLIEALNQP